MSNMVVRTNVFALNAHRNLTNTGLQQRTAAQRLSSGYRINSAADDAAGLAITESMRAQIRGLDQASINAQDAVGLIQTAEGAMSTISDMVIRIRELMVQAANDTNTLKNRDMIQEEIDQIMTEINDVTFRTQFNTRTLLSGGLGGEGGGPSSPVSLQWMLFEQARVIGTSHPGGIVTTNPNGTIGRLPNVHQNENDRNQTSLRNSVIQLQNEMNALARRVAERMATTPNNGFDKSNVTAAFEDIRSLDFSNLDMIDSEVTELQSIANRLDNLLRRGLTAAEEVYQITQDQINALGGAGALNSDGVDVFSGTAVHDWANDSTDVGLPDVTVTTGTGTVATSVTIPGNGDTITGGAKGLRDAAATAIAQITMAIRAAMDASSTGFTTDHGTLDGTSNTDNQLVNMQLIFRHVVGEIGSISSTPLGMPAPANHALSYLENLLDRAKAVLGNINLESNAMWFQIGANSMQGMVLQLQGIHTGILGGGRGDLAMLIDVRESSGIPISEQLDFIDMAEGIVNKQRAQLGAVQNRLEFTRQSLDISSENLSAAESRIRDTDMAREMMRFTQSQVLQQAGISMLAQANQLPSSILQLLQ